MQQIQKAEALRMNGHYSFAVEAKGMVFVSGSFSTDPQTGERKFGSVYEETTQALTNIELIVKQAGGDRYNIVKTTAYVCSMEDWAEVNRAYVDFFRDYKPARTIVNAKELHFGFKVEIEAQAVLG